MSDTIFKKSETVNLECVKDIVINRRVVFSNIQPVSATLLGFCVSSTA